MKALQFLSTPVLLAAALVALGGCAGKEVTRISTNTTTDLSGRWNDADSRMVAEDMLKDCLDRPWIQAYQSKGKIPRIVVGQIRNRSHEHIPVQTFINDIQRTLVNSGKAEMVADATVREELRTEVGSQTGNATTETKQEAKAETGAELMLTGEISSIVDKEGDEAVVFYQVDLTLIEIQSHKKVWIGDKKIKKFVEQSSLKL
ncbi:MAG TPA: penicillin-binding protein activator LpoB [Fibrobacteria bacterium]|nr:penicillin-binding protein activator LpoB [Fibrobacteria bacterium]HOX53305.1 penicillin-binding protein activator LpoB [Fibrobacteria bacterium]